MYIDFGVYNIYVPAKLRCNEKQYYYVYQFTVLNDVRARKTDVTRETHCCRTIT